jgi:hypothetical protein
MAKKQSEVSEKLLEVFSTVTPANPKPIGADRRYLLGLQKRGFTPTEIINVAAKAGFKLTPEFFVLKKKNEAPAAQT